MESSSSSSSSSSFSSSPSLTSSTPHTPHLNHAHAARLFRIDMHTHMMPPSLPDLLSLSETASYPWPSFRPVPSAPSSKQNDTEQEEEMEEMDMYVGSQFFRRVQQNCFSPTARLAEMDTAGVDVQVLSTVPVLFCYDAPIRPAITLARALNDHLAGVSAQYPDRFVWLGTIPLQDTAAAEAELRRIMELGAKGIQIGTSIDADTGLDEERLERIWEVCEELDCPVFVHPLGYALVRENKARWGKYWGSWLVGMPCETALAIHALTMSGVFVRHPKLRMCFAHGGGAFPALLGRIQHGFDCRPDLVATKACGVTPTEHLEGKTPDAQMHSDGQIWIDSLMHDPDLLEYVLRKMGPGGARRIVLGSDYPFPLGEVPVAGKMLLEDERVRLFMSWEERAGVLAENAIRFLNLGDEFMERCELRLRQAGAPAVESPRMKTRNELWGDTKFGRPLKVVDSDWEVSSASGSL